MLDFSKYIGSAKIFLRQNSRAILTCGCVILTVSSVIEAIKATSDAKDILDDAEYEKFESLGCPEDPNIDYHLTTGEIIRHTWKCYIWTFLLLTGAITCGVASHVESSKRIRTATVAYSSMLEMYNTYRDNVQRVLKDKDRMAINHATMHDIVEKDRSSFAENAYNRMLTVDDDTLLLLRDVYGAKVKGAYFKRTASDISKAEGKFNRILMDQGKATLNDWYDCLDLGHSELGDYYGWEWDKDGPLYAVVIPDDFNVVEDRRVVSGLGLAESEYTKFFKPFRQLY